MSHLPVTIIPGLRRPICRIRLYDGPHEPLAYAQLLALAPWTGRRRSRILAGAPVRFLALGGYHGRFDLFGQSIGIAVGAPGPI